MSSPVTLASLREHTEQQLDSYLPNELHEPLSSAMRYSTLNGGKRLRAMLVYAAGLPFGATLEQLDISACAIECIHAYSLIHDDLPAMDDDDLRRGKPTSHIQFDEATAILAGDALQTHAFQLLSNSSNADISDSNRLKMIQVLAKASGTEGMVGGQMLDILATNQGITLDELKLVHSLKTSALIEASILLGALSSQNVNDTDYTLLSDYGKKIGLAFQIIDDILDETADTATLGKKAGADKLLGKSTYTALLGVDNARKQAHELIDSALQSLDDLSHNTPPELIKLLVYYIYTTCLQIYSKNTRH